MVRSEYVDNVKSKDLIYGALKGMVQSLDKFSEFMDPGSYAEMKVETEGEFGGIGIEIAIKDDILTVIAPIDDTPAYKAGLKAGDLILAIDGNRINHWAELENVIHKSGGKKKLQVLRDGKELTFEVTPKYNEDAKVHLIGISRQDELVVRQYGFGESITKGVSSGIEMTGKLFVVIKGLVFGEYSLKTLGGPIMIAQVAGKAAESGIADLLSLVAFLSLQLGIINLFPIPVLDGGHIVFFGMEALKGKPLSEKFMTISQQVGIALLIGLMVLVTWNDLARIFG